MKNMVFYVKNRSIPNVSDQNPNNAKIFIEYYTLIIDILNDITKDTVEVSNIPNLQNLPTVLTQSIMSYLPDITKLELTSKNLAKDIQSDIVWKTAYNNRWKNELIDEPIPIFPCSHHKVCPPENITWKQRYQLRDRIDKNWNKDYKSIENLPLKNVIYKGKSKHDIMERGEFYYPISIKISLKHNIFFILDSTTVYMHNINNDSIYSYDKKYIPSFPHSYFIDCFDYNEKTQTLVTCSSNDEIIKIWNINDDKAINEIKIPTTEENSNELMNILHIH